MANWQNYEYFTRNVAFFILFKFFDVIKNKQKIKKKFKKIIYKKSSSGNNWYLHGWAAV